MNVGEMEKSSYAEEGDNHNSKILKGISLIVLLFASYLLGKTDATIEPPVVRFVVPSPPIEAYMHKCLPHQLETTFDAIGRVQTYCYE